jgi:hypothetical protein
VKLSDLVSRGVRLIVTDTEADANPAAREIAAEDLLEAEPRRTPQRNAPPPPPTSAVPADVESFAAVYEEAGIALPDHGWGIDKVAEMLESKRLGPLSREVKATAVLAAVEAAGVAIRDVIQDAVRRDKALDAFEEAKSAETSELRAASEARIQAIKEEIDTFLREKNQEIEQLKAAADAASQAFTQLQTRKRREEERLHDVVAHFLEGSENPVTTEGNARPGTPQPPPRSSGT